MKLLVVMSNYPFPPRTGSTIVAFNMLKLLSKHHSINLISLQSKQVHTLPAKYVNHVELVTQAEVSSPTKWIRHIYYSLLGDPPSVSIYSSKVMKQKVESEIEKGQFDAVLLFEMSAIQYCPATCFHKLIVNIEDPQSIKLNRMQDLSVWTLWQKTKLLVLTKLTASYEDRILHKMAKVLMLSEADVYDMGKNSSLTNLAHVPYGVDQRNSSDIIEYENRDKVIIFSGSMYHPPNIDGALFLIQDVFPRILKVHPNVKLQIVGAEPDGRIYEAASRFGKNIEITGRVQSVDEYIRRATVSVCPVRLKIGVQTKILEALSWGTPTVSTSAGNSGISGKSGIHLWVEDDAHLFAKRVCDLLEGKNWKKLSEEGRKLVTERFTWERSAAQLEQYLLSVASSY